MVEFQHYRTVRDETTHISISVVQLKDEKIFIKLCIQIDCVLDKHIGYYLHSRKLGIKPPLFTVCY